MRHTRFPASKVSRPLKPIYLQREIEHNLVRVQVKCYSILWYKIPKFVTKYCVWKNSYIGTIIKLEDNFKMPQLYVTGRARPLQDDMVGKSHLGPCFGVGGAQKGLKNYEWNFFKRKRRRRRRHRWQILPLKKNWTLKVRVKNLLLFCCTLDTFRHLIMKHFDSSICSQEGSKVLLRHFTLIVTINIMAKVLFSKCNVMSYKYRRLFFLGTFCV